MKACCSNKSCYKEFVLPDDADISCYLCDNCESELITARKTGYKNIWISPNIVLLRFKELVQKVGSEPAVKNTKFKHEREAWVSAIWALGMASETKKEYWIEIETIENTPDTYVYYIDQINGNNHRKVFNVECVDWEEHESDLLKIIKNKCSKSYPDYFTLLIYARHPGIKVDMEKIYSETQKLTIPFGQIWLMGEKTSGLFQMFQLHPNKSFIEFDLIDTQKLSENQIEFSTFLQRGTGTEMEDLGKLYLPIPDL